MSREKKERNLLILQDINKGEYLIDIAKKYNVSPAMISKIKKRFLKLLKQKTNDTTTK
jgi:Mor family transcriptional regulator